MPNYKETTATGTQYVRCNHIAINNPLNEQSMVVFNEQTVLFLGDETIVRSADGCQLLVEPAAEITVLDPATNLPTGEVVTHGRLYQLLYSAYIQTALERDAEVFNA